MRRRPYREAMTPDPLDPAAVRAEVTRSLHVAGLPPVGRLEVLAETASTSTWLVTAASADPGAWPDRSVVVADHQQAGRGRAGRTWTTPARSALTVSVLLRPGVPVDRWGWLPLVAGLAVVHALADVAGVSAGLKWPNDVLVAPDDAPTLAGWGRRRKVAGLLAEMVPAATGTEGGTGTTGATGAVGSPGPAVVLGIGVNVSQAADQLPVPSATSLALVGAAVDRTRLLGAVLSRLTELDQRWRAADGDAGRAGLAHECAAACVTLGRPVVVDLPGGGELRGTATALAADGALVVVDGVGRSRSVLAGDVRLRSDLEAEG